MLRGTFAIIDLRAIRHNVQAVASLLNPGTQLLVAVKANGYGHGAVQAAEAAIAGGATWLGVAMPEEALHLRANGITVPILCLGAITPEAARRMAEANVDVTIGDDWNLSEIPSFPTPLSVHIKIDTGMTRLGVRSADAAVRLMQTLAARPDIRVRGVFTHLACADAGDLSHAEGQVGRFRSVIARLREAGLPEDAILHAANSAAALRRPDWHLGMVRLGISAYGYPPSEDFDCPVELQPAMHVYSCITRILEVEAGTTVGYGATWTAPRATKVATVPIGYADGYFRVLSNRAHALIGDQLAPVIGRVCMDQLMLDVTDIPQARIGQPVTMFGRSAPPEWNWQDLAAEDERQQLSYLMETFRAFDPAVPAKLLSAASVAALAGTISYELLCALSDRVRKCYIPF